MFAGLVEQGERSFQGYSGKKLAPIKACMVALLVPFWFLSTFYKGENIARLAAPARMIPIDTIQKVVSANMKLYSIPVFIQQTQANLPTNDYAEYKYHQINNHEAFPVVSQLRDFLYQEEIDSNSVNQFYPLNVSKKMEIYWNHSELFPSWNFVKNMSNPVEYFQALLIPYLLPCKASAIIATENVASVLLQNLINAKKPVYMQEEPVMEYINGFRLDGAVSVKYFNLIVHFFSSGIVDWWNKYFTLVAKRKNISLLESREQKEHSLIMFLILLFGYVVAATVFFLFEKKLRARVYFGTNWQYLLMKKTLFNIQS